MDVFYYLCRKSLKIYHLIYLMLKSYLLRAAVAAFAVASGATSVSAASLFVGPEAKNQAAGTTITYRGYKFSVGTTAFDGIWGALGSVKDGDVIYFSPNTIGSFTVNTPNVTLVGANAWCDAESGQRSEAETNITGTLKINASGVTVNGFRFTGAGRVLNDEAGRGSTCLKNFRFIYNKADNSTLGNGDAILYLGTPWRPSGTVAEKTDPSKWAAIERYQDIEVAHNYFAGKDADNQPDAVHIAGGGVLTDVHNNYFENGGTSVSLYNMQGQMRVEHNRFRNVGAGKRKQGTATGAFCIRLFYIGASAVADQSATAYIRHNDFDGCQGQSGMYSLVRFFSGDSNEAIYKPNNTRIYLNYNIFRNKTSVNSSGYNYVFYGNQTNTTTAEVDHRWNEFDNSEMCMAWTRPSWETTGQRYFAGSSMQFNYESSHGTTVGFYGKKDSDGKAEFGRVTPTGGAGGLKGWTVGTQSVTGIPIHTVVQSADIDDATGDIYLINECKTTNTFGTRTVNAFPNFKFSDTFLFMSRVAMGGNETHMYLAYGGHGSNMAVTRHQGKVWVLTGGNGTQTSTTPTDICIFPWLDGDCYDLRYATKLNRSYASGTHPYPGVDNDNRLLVVRTRTSAGDNFSVYDLDDAMNNPGSARPIKVVFVKEGDRKITGSSRTFLNTADKGFKTWSDQGFTISGDYIYTYEGNGKEGYSGTPTPTDGKSTLIVNVINWRTGEYIKRSAILKKEVWTDMCAATDDSGEPESLKIHRDADGRPFMAIGIITAKGGSYKTPRKYNMFAYKLKQENGQGDAWTIPSRQLSASVYSLNMQTSGDPVSAGVSVARPYMVEGSHACLVGPDCGTFSFSADGAAYNVTFTPDRRKKEKSARLRVSAPTCPDLMIPVSAMYTGSTTGTEDITAVGDAVVAEGYYDLTGRRLSEPQPGLNIIRYTDGTARKVIID